MEFEVVPELAGDEQNGSFMQDMRVACEHCGRKFNPDVALKHVPICKRNFEKKHGPVRNSLLASRK